MITRSRSGNSMLRLIPKGLAVSAMLFFAWEFVSLPYFSIAMLRFSNPSETALMRQRIGEAEGKGETLTLRHDWIPLARLPSHAVRAVVVAEDGLFYQHGGFDWYEIQESVKRNVEEGRAARGGSTITQQLAKNLYLSTDKTAARKFREVAITVLLERQLSKDRILELYLNVIEWGKGVFGIETAARRFFGKSASDLTLEESLRLAAVIPSPLRYSANGDSRYVRTRVEIIRQRMRGHYGTE